MTGTADPTILTPPVPAPGRGRFRRWWAVAACVALVAAGAGLFLAAGPRAARPGRRLGADVAVNAGARDPRDLSANNSPSVARNPVDPANLVVANRIDRPRFSCAAHSTFDGGATWVDVPVPFPDGEELPARCYTPDVTYDPAGTLYVTFVTLQGLGNSPNAVWVTSSTDGGRHLAPPTRVGGPLNFQVRLTADPTRPNHLYVSWLHAEQVGNLLFPTTGNPILLTETVDGGVSWSEPVRVSPPARARVIAPAPAVGPHGEVYVAYLDVGDDRLDYEGGHEGRGGPPYPGPWALVTARSTDHGATWTETTIDAGIVPTERFIVFLPPTPSVAVDPHTGTVYVAFTDGRAGDADVHIWASHDRGATFNPGVRVNDTRLGDGTAQYLPKVTVAPGGRVDVAYYDRRADPANIMNQVSFQSSYNGARTFTHHTTLSDRAFDSRVGYGSERGLTDLGSRLALISTTTGALAVWCDTRAGTDASSKQDLARAIIQTRPPHPTRLALRTLAATVIVGGLLGAGVTFRRRRPKLDRSVVAVDGGVLERTP